MSVSYPYNILVTKNPKVAETIFFDNLGRTSFTDAFSRLSPEEQEDSLIVSPRSNNNFVSLSLDFPQGGNTHKFVVLRMLETNELLEYFTVSKTGFEEVITQKLRTSIKLGKTNSEILDQLRKIRPSFYFSLGIGDNIKEWSGPYLVQLIDVNFSITSDGVREVELMFSPLLASQLVFTNKLFNDTKLFQGGSLYDSGYNGRDAQVRVAYDGVYDFSVKQSTKASMIKTTGRAIPWKSPSAEKEWNFVVRDLIRSYLSKIAQVPKGNILVLLDDDFSYITKEPTNENRFDSKGQIFNVYELYKDELLKLGFRVNPTYDESGLETEENQKDLKNLEAQIQAHSAGINRLKNKIAADTQELYDTLIKYSSVTTANKLKSRVADQNIDFSKYSPANFSLMDTFYSIAGRDITSEGDKKAKKLAETIRQDTKALNEDIANISMEQKKAKPAQNRNKYVQDRYRSNPDFLNPDQKSNLVNLTKLIISIGGKIGQSDVDSNSLALLEPLTKIANVLKSEGNKPNDFTIFEEDNYKILKLLKESGVIADDQEAVLVFGREKVIKPYLYPADTKELPSLDLVESYLTPEEVLLRNNLFQKDGGSQIPFEIYGRAYKTLFKSNITRTSSFNEKVDLGEYYNDYISNVEDGSLVFMHNVKNSNVISLSFDSSPYKQLLLDTATESAYKVLDEALDSGLISLDDSLDTSSLNGLVKEITLAVSSNSADLRSGKKSLYDVLTTLTGNQRDRVIKILLDAKDVNDNTNQASFLDLVLYLALRSNGEGKPDVPNAAVPISREVPPGKRLAEHADRLRKMAKYIVSVNIKTLPFFNNIDSFNRPCFLFGLSNFVVGSDLKKVWSPSFFTNNYTIIGYKHVITAADAYSEFSLIGDANSFGSINTKGGMAGLFGIELEKVVKQREEDKKRKEAKELGEEKLNTNLVGPKV